MWRSVLVAAALMGGAAPAFAQTGRVSGTVLSTTGEPIIGARVSVVGTGNVVLTGDDGRYALTVRNGTYTLRASRIGYSADSSRNVVVPSSGSVTVNFRLAAAAARISGVVVTGYGSRDVRDRTGVVETVKESQFNTGRVISPEELIQAKVPGVQVLNSNEPGGGISLRIRGASSVNASSEPLIVLDGVPLQVGGGVSSGRNPLNFLNPNDIESISVLKDASATSIYGSRGANGVLLITTKSGGDGFSYSSSLSNSMIANELDLLNATQYRAAANQFGVPATVALLGTANTDWRGAIMRDATGREHSLSVGGGEGDRKYRLSMNYLSQDGVVLASATKRLSAAISLQDKLYGDRLTYRMNLKGSRTADGYTPGGVIGNATAMAPTQPILNANGTFFEWANNNGVNNPLSELNLVRESGTAYRSVGNIEARYRLPFIDNLTANIRTGFDFAQAERTNFIPSNNKSELENSRGGNFFRNNPQQLNTVLEVFGNYTRRVNALKGDFEFTGGYTFEESRGDFPSFFADSLSTNFLGQNGVPTARIQRNFLNIQESRLISFFGRSNFSITDKYLFTVAVRRDGSSRFGPENQWGLFPSAAVAWRLVDEPFLKNIKQLSDLKLRASWGKNGNQSFANYQQYPVYTPGSPQAAVQFGNQFVTTIRPSAVDPNIKWESTTSTNLGLDFGLFNSRINGSFEIYDKQTDDLIFTIPVPAGTAVGNFVTTNVGSMQNRGWEALINAAVLRGGANKLTWDASFAFSANRNKLLSINAFGTGAEQILVGGIAGGVGSTIQVLQPGFPLNSFFVYQHKRENGKPVYRDVDNNGTINEQDLYVDRDGNNIINQQDRKPFEQPAPKLIIGHTSNLAWKNWDMSLTARAHLGNYVYNNVASNLGHYESLTRSDPTAIHASALETGFTRPQYFSDYYVEDASFLRLDNITLGYTFRSGMANIKNVRVYGTMQNAFTFTGYSGLDPASVGFGIDNNIFPLSRTVTVGASFRF
jgi:iron complex outermembrane receptor protein